MSLDIVTEREKLSASTIVIDRSCLHGLSELAYMRSRRVTARWLTHGR